MTQVDMNLIERFVETGDPDAYAEIIKLHSGMVYAVCSRILRDQALAEDVCQETFLKLLHKADTVKGSLSCWLHTTATWKAIDLIRRDSSRRKREVGHAVEKLQNEESTWAEISPYIDQAMAELPELERKLLVEHFLEGKSKTFLAEEAGVSQATVTRRMDAALDRVRKHLEKSGFTLGIASLLSFFNTNMVETAPKHLVEELGKMTIYAGAKAGICKTFLGTKALTISLGVIIVGTTTWVALHSADKPPSRTELRSAHFTVQSPYSEYEAPSSLSKGAYEQWFYYPEGAEGPIFMRMQRWSPTQEEKWCSWLQDAEANYYYHAGENRIYIANYRLWLGSLRTRTLPTDPPEFVERINSIEGTTYGVEHVRHSKIGYLRSATDHRFIEVPQFRTDYRYNTITADFFEYDWGPEIEIVDTRDAIHRQGWAYFSIEGHLGDEPIRGTGRIPLVYRHVEEHSAWLDLTLGDNRRIIDCRDGAFLHDSDAVTTYPRGHFFLGLARPWMGMHTIDIIRRDAVRCGIPYRFNIPQSDEIFYVDLTLLYDRNFSRTRITYRIDMRKDLIESITFLYDNGDGQPREGHLEFSYYERIPENEAAAFDEPSFSDRITPEPPNDAATTLWMLDL